MSEYETGMDDDDQLLVPDFSEAVDFEPVGPGRYPVVVVSAEGPWLWGSSKANPYYPKSGKPAKQQLMINCEVVDGPGLEDSTLAGRRLRAWTGDLGGDYSWITLRALKVLLPDYTRGTLNVREITEALIGQMATVEVIEDTRSDTDEKVDKIRSFVALV